MNIGQQPTSIWRTNSNVNLVYIVFKIVKREDLCGGEQIFLRDCEKSTTSQKNPSSPNIVSDCFHITVQTKINIVIHRWDKKSNIKFFVFTNNRFRMFFYYQNRFSNITFVMLIANSIWNRFVLFSIKSRLVNLAKHHEISSLIENHQPREVTFEMYWCNASVCIFSCFLNVVDRKDWIPL